MIMGTKILYYDEDGDLCFGVAEYAGLYEDDRKGNGVWINTTDGDSFFIQDPFPEDVVKRIYENDKVDLTRYGNVADPD